MKAGMLAAAVGAGWRQPISHEQHAWCSPVQCITVRGASMLSWMHTALHDTPTRGLEAARMCGRHWHGISVDVEEMKVLFWT